MTLKTLQIPLTSRFCVVVKPDPNRPSPAHGEDGEALMVAVLLMRLSLFLEREFPYYAAYLEEPK